MTDDSKYLSPEEREEYDRMMHEACFTKDGKARQSDDLSMAVHRGLVAAQSASQSWADWMRESDEMSGHLKRGTQWRSAHRTVRAQLEGREVTKRAHIGVKTKTSDGTTTHQPTLWGDLTDAQYADFIRDRGADKLAADQDIAMARRYREALATARKQNLIKDTGKETGRDAIKALGFESDEEFLLSDWKAS